MENFKSNKQRFFRFLKENNAYTRWKANFIEEKERQDDTWLFSIKREIRETSFRKVINYSFQWNNTNEGYDFWRNLDALYKKTFYSGKNVF